jgi:uncharacterized protein YuzE
MPFEIPTAARAEDFQGRSQPRRILTKNWIDDVTARGVRGKRSGNCSGHLLQNIKTEKIPLWRKAMKVEYDQQTDTLTISLREAKIRESDEVRPGVIVDFGEDGAVVRFEILDASRVVDRTREMQFALAEA